MFRLLGLWSCIFLGILSAVLASCTGGGASLRSAGRDKKTDRSDNTGPALLTEPGQPFYVDKENPLILGRIFVSDSGRPGRVPTNSSAQLMQCTYLIPAWLFARTHDALSGVDPKLPKLFATPRYDKALALHSHYLASADVDGVLSGDLTRSVRRVGLDKRLMTIIRDANLITGAVFTTMFGGIGAAMVVAGAPASIPLLLSGSVIGGLGYAIAAWDEVARAYLDGDTPDPKESGARVTGFSDPYQNDSKRPILQTGPAKPTYQNNFDPGVVHQTGFLKGNKLLNKHYSGYVDLLTDLEVNVALDARAKLGQLLSKQSPAAVPCPSLSGNSEKPEGALNDDDSDGGIRRRVFEMPEVTETELREVWYPVPVPAGDPAR